MNKKIILVLLLLWFVFMRLAASSTGDGQSQGNKIFKSFIKTVLLYKAGFEMAAPVILLNSDDHLQLSFDDMDSDLKRYRFTIVHCENDWSVSTDITESDYIDGYREDNIDRFEYSANTTVHYTHYSLLFPTNNLRPEISGNYILKVYIDDPENMAFICRFMVVEPSPAGITGNVHQATNVMDQFTRQEVDFEVRFNGMRVSNPGQELKVVITQNDRWDNAIRNLKPRFVRSESLDYNYDQENTFNGWNEFRNLDLKSLVSQSERIRRITYDTGGYNVYLWDDARRGTKNYVTDKDINGRMLIKSDDHAENSDIEADYARVHFSLPCDLPLPGRLYLLGALTNWQTGNESLMIYNAEKKAYEKELFLKQGYYNYLYLFRDERRPGADETVIEGNHWETENEYTIWLYYHELGGLYDRLIAVQNFTSNH